MEEPPIHFEVFGEPPPDVMSPQESSEEKKDDDHKEEDELQQLGITGFKKYFLAFLFLPYCQKLEIKKGGQKL